MRLAIVLSAIALAGCVASEPAISSFNGSSVTVQAAGLEPNSPPGPEEIAVANEACGSAGKQARYASKRFVGEARVEYLFLCV